MGRNADIKRYDAHAQGQPMDLFGAPDGRLPVILELLRSPWIVKGTDVSDSGSDVGSRCVEEVVDVSWDGVRRCPAVFAWHERTYRIDAVVQTWHVERAWWSPSRRVSRRCFRVLARGGVYDLAYDRLGSRWLLLGIAD